MASPDLLHHPQEVGPAELVAAEQLRLHQPVEAARPHPLVHLLGVVAARVGLRLALPQQRDQRLGPLHRHLRREPRLGLGDRFGHGHTVQGADVSH